MPNPNTLTGKVALAAVKQNGEALHYVRDDSTYDSICAKKGMSHG